VLRFLRKLLAESAEWAVSAVNGDPGRNDGDNCDVPLESCENLDLPVGGGLDNAAAWACDGWLAARSRMLRRLKNLRTPEVRRFWSGDTGERGIASASGATGALFSSFDVSSASVGSEVLERVEGVRGGESGGAGMLVPAVNEKLTGSSVSG
jgi:hypothetical protein